MVRTSTVTVATRGTNSFEVETFSCNWYRALIFSFCDFRWSYEFLIREVFGIFIHLFLKKFQKSYLFSINWVIWNALPKIPRYFENFDSSKKVNVSLTAHVDLLFESIQFLIKATQCHHCHAFFSFQKKKRNLKYYLLIIQWNVYLKFEFLKKKFSSPTFYCYVSTAQ